MKRSDCNVRSKYKAQSDPMETNRSNTQKPSTITAEQEGIIFDIKHYAIHDGPGIRTTVFLKGCPLSCQWCANPESQKLSPEIMFDESLCVQCGSCASLCPHNAIEFNSNQRLFRRSVCTGCGECAGACVFDAVELCGNPISVRTLWDKVKDDRAFWDRSNGGVTLSGGEPLLQARFTGAFLRWCRERNVHTAIETCGQVSEESFRKILSFVDFVIFDYKLADSAKHKKYTGMSNGLITKNLMTLLKSSKKILIRMPLVPGINDAPEDLRKIGDLLSCTKPGVKLELLAYHQLGQGKYNKLGMEYLMKGVASPTSDQVQVALGVLAQYNLCLVAPAKGGQN